MPSGGEVSVSARDTFRNQQELNTFYDGFGGRDSPVPHTLRRVGENESDAIETCRALVSASNQLGAVAPGQPVPSQSLHGYYFQPVIASDSRRGASNRSAAAAPAFVADPAQYRASGVMAFIVTRDGSVFEKDLGNDTAKIAKSISSGSLDSSWQVVE